MECRPSSGYLLLWQEIADMKYGEEATPIPPPPVTNTTPSLPVAKPKSSSSPPKSNEAIKLNEAYVEQQVSKPKKNILSELEMSQKIQQGVTLVYISYKIIIILNRSIVIDIKKA